MATSYAMQGMTIVGLWDASVSALKSPTMPIAATTSTRHGTNAQCGKPKRQRRMPNDPSRCRNHSPINPPRRQKHRRQYPVCWRSLSNCVVWEQASIMSRMSQNQRRRQIRLDDLADSIACAERAHNRCEVCGNHCTYPYASLHHARRKRTMEDRRNRDWHVWLCFLCHEAAHGFRPQRINEACERIIADRDQS